MLITDYLGDFVMKVEFQNKQELMSIVNDDEKLSKAIAVMGHEVNASNIAAVRNFFSDESKFDAFKDMCGQAYGDLAKSEYWQSINHPKDKGFDVSKICIALPDKRRGRCFHDVGHNEDVVSVSPLSFAIDFSQHGLDKPDDQKAYVKAVLAHEFTHADQYNREGNEAPRDYLPNEKGVAERGGKKPSWFEEGLHEGECRATAMTIVMKDGDSEKVQKAVAQKQCGYKEGITMEDLPKDYKDAFGHLFGLWDEAATSPDRQDDDNYVSSEAAASKMSLQFREYNHNYDGQRISTQDLTKIVASAKNVSKAFDIERKHIQELSRGTAKKDSQVTSNKQNINVVSRTTLPQQSRQ